MMKKLSTFVYGFLLTICSITASLAGEIIETNEIRTLIPFVNQDSFIFLNVTGTLYAPSNALADRRWRDYFAGRVEEVIGDQETGLQLVNKIKNQIVNNISKKAIEEITPRLIAYLQEKRIVVLGITQKQMATSYADNFGEITRNHLLSLDIQLEKTLKYFPALKENRGQNDFSFAYGLLFTNKQPVGRALLSFLKQSGRLPFNIIMVDNSRDALESAQEALESIGIAFTGIRYGRADAKEEFDPTLGTIEFLAFMNEGKILADEEALKIMPTDKSMNYEALLDKYIQQAVHLNRNPSDN